MCAYVCVFCVCLRLCLRLCFLFVLTLQVTRKRAYDSGILPSMIALSYSQHERVRRCVCCLFFICLLLFVVCLFLLLLIITTTKRGNCVVGNLCIRRIGSNQLHGQ